MRTLRSDNNAGLCPEAIDAIVRANHEHAIAYGDDEITASAVEAFRTIFGPETAVFFVATGTAANTLSITALTEPWQQVVCHVHSHYQDDESTAPERITHCRTVAVHRDDSKLTPEDVHRVGQQSRGDVHQPQPGVVTISNTTEFGTVYTPDEVTGICEAAHSMGYRVHVDGARLSNAIAALGCNARAVTADAGVDAVSFGGTKNGLAYGEAVLFFRQGNGRTYERAVETFPFHRKGTGHLLSKHRFVSAPFAATLADSTWLRHATHANRMAARLAGGLGELGLTLRFPCEANGVFVELDTAMDEALQARGHGYYSFGDASWRLFRLMCSFDTDPQDVDRFVADARTAQTAASA